MSYQKVPYRGSVRTTNVPQTFSKSRLIASLSILLFLGGCDSLGFPKKTEPEPAPLPPAPVVIEPSSDTITNPSSEDIHFAQSALNKLGFKAGQVDGIWGPRSQRAIRNFERINTLKSANGGLSELNLKTLENLSGLNRIEFTGVEVKVNNGIASKLDRNAPLSEGPQLVIIDKAYNMLAKPNPFSENLAQLAAGTGIYIISLQEGWYEVESEQRIRGYIKAE